MNVIELFLNNDYQSGPGNLSTYTVHWACGHPMGEQPHFQNDKPNTVKEAQSDQPKTVKEAKREEEGKRWALLSHWSR